MKTVSPAKVELPGREFLIYWGSTVIMVGLGAAIYPQAIQRLFAAQSLSALKSSLSWMVLMPLVTVLILFLLGVISMPNYVGVETASKDSVLPDMLMRLTETSAAGLILATLVIVGLLAAIMSTADSILLTMSSILVKDLVAPLRRDLSEESLTRYGKIISLVLMTLLVLWALHPTLTLWGLIELKMQLLVQLAPMLVLGLYTRVRVKPIIAGVSVGLAVALLTFVLGYKRLGGVQVGLIALLLNLSVVWIVEKVARE